MPHLPEITIDDLTGAESFLKKRMLERPGDLAPKFLGFLVRDGWDDNHAQLKRFLELNPPSDAESLKLMPAHSAILKDAAAFDLQKLFDRTEGQLNRRLLLTRLGQAAAINMGITGLTAGVTAWCDAICSGLSDDEFRSGYNEKIGDRLDMTRDQYEKWRGRLLWAGVGGGIMGVAGLYPLREKAEMMEYRAASDFNAHQAHVDRIDAAPDNPLLSDYMEALEAPLQEKLKLLNPPARSRS